MSEKKEIGPHQQARAIEAMRCPTCTCVLVPVGEGARDCRNCGVRWKPGQRYGYPWHYEEIGAGYAEAGI